MPRVRRVLSVCLWWSGGVGLDTPRKLGLGVSRDGRHDYVLQALGFGSQEATWIILISTPTGSCICIHLNVVRLYSVCTVFSSFLLFNHSVVSNSLRLYRLQHFRLLCPLLSPRACSSSCPLSQWCHPTILSSVVCFSCLQSFPALASFLMSWLIAPGGQSIGASASPSVLPMNIQGWFPLGLTGLISSHSKGLSRVFCNTTVQKHQFFGAQSSLWSNSHIHTWLLEKTIALTRRTFVCKVMTLLFNTLSRFVIAVLPRSKPM